MKTLKRAGILAIAVALIATEATFLYSQQSAPTDDTVYQKPSNYMMKHMNAPITRSSSNAGSVAGKAQVGPASATMPTKPTKPTVLGNEAKRVVPPPQTAAQVKNPIKFTDAQPEYKQTEYKLSDSKQPAELKQLPEPNPLVPSKPPTDIRQVGYDDANRILTPDGYDPTISQKKMKRIQPQPQIHMMPPNQGNAPQIHGSIVGLRGETATERLVQATSMLSESERENAELKQQIANMQAAYKESRDQLMSAVKEIQTARREISSARSDLERLRGEISGLRQKLQVAEKEHSSLLQTMGPLLQQLLDSSNDVSALPPNPPE